MTVDSRTCSGWLSTASSSGLQPAGIEIRRSSDEEFDAWLDRCGRRCGPPRHARTALARRSSRARSYLRAERDLAAAGVVRYVALRDGAFAGGAGLRMAEGIAQFAGAATAPAHRRRGIQSALLSTRLADAAAAGCDVAVITTQPGSTSQQNAQRRGFRPALHTRHFGQADLTSQPVRHCRRSVPEPPGKSPRDHLKWSTRSSRKGPLTRRNSITRHAGSDR